MGNFGSYNTSVPAGGTLIILQDPEECLTGKPVLKETVKPAALAAMPDSVWKGFASKVGDACSRCWDERLPFLGMVFALYPIVNIFMTFAGVGSGDVDSYETSPNNPNFMITFACMAAAFGVIFGGRVAVCSRNVNQDQFIIKACQELTLESGGAFTAEYRTQWTGLCKPKNARTMRVIAIGSSAGFGGSAVYGGVQSIMVTVPPGVTPGSTLQVQTPSGLASATVPPGVAPGQSFAFTPMAVPAPVIVQAQVVGGPGAEGGNIA